MKTKNVYNVEMTSIQEMLFSKHIRNNGIAMNTKTAKEREDFTIKWLKQIK